MERARPYVLVVADLPDAADGLADLAALWGYDAEAHYGGPSALVAAAARPPAVVVLDIAMPRMDGFAFAVLLRELPGCVHTALVVVSGQTGGDSQARCCRLSVGHYLFKPVEPGVVRELLATLVADPEAAGGRTRLPVAPGPETCGPESCDFLRRRPRWRSAPPRSRRHPSGSDPAVAPGRGRMGLGAARPGGRHCAGRPVPAAGG